MILVDLPGDHMVPGTSTSNSDGIAGRSWGSRPTISIQFPDFPGILEMATGRSKILPPVDSCDVFIAWHQCSRSAKPFRDSDRREVRKRTFEISHTRAYFPIFLQNPEPVLLVDLLGESMVPGTSTSNPDGIAGRS